MISDSVTSIGKHVFTSCHNLSSIEVKVYELIVETAVLLTITGTVLVIKTKKKED